MKDIELVLPDSRSFSAVVLSTACLCMEYRAPSFQPVGSDCLLLPVGRSSFSVLSSSCPFCPQFKVYHSTLLPLMKTMPGRQFHCCYVLLPVVFSKNQPTPQFKDLETWLLQKAHPEKLPKPKGQHANSRHHSQFVFFTFKSRP